MEEFYIYAGDTKHLLFSFYDKTGKAIDVTVYDIYLKLKDMKENIVIIEKYRKSGSLNVIGDMLGTGDGEREVFNTSFCPVIPGSEKIYVNDIEKIGDRDYTIDYLTGEIRFNVAPAEGTEITADYQHLDKDVRNGIITYSDEYERQLYDITEFNQIAVIFEREDTEKLKPGVYPFVIEFRGSGICYTVYRGEIIIKERYEDE